MNATPIQNSAKTTAAPRENATVDKAKLIKRSSGRKESRS
jgi:hypothetical protein